MWRCFRHEKTCDGKVNYQFPVGAYHVAKTIFEELEQEENMVPEEERYFPFRATFDFECFFDKERARQLKNTEKLNWQSSHVPLSLSVCSNVPEYQEPRCFISNGDPNQMLEKFVKYLTEISTKSSFLLRQIYAAAFEALHQASSPNHGATENNHENKEENFESEDEEARGIDLMTSDNEEDEEEIEPENEDDRAFLDDGTEEQKDMSFYRRLNAELDNERRLELGQKRQEIADCEDMLFGEAQTSENQVLNKLEKKFNEYLNELPVLGFNPGKYDLNAVKEFIFPYMIKHQPIRFTVKRNNNHVYKNWFSETSRYLQLCCTRIQLWSVLKSLRVRTDQRILSIRMDWQSGQARRNLLTTSRSLLLIPEEHKHHRPRVYLLSASVARKYHDYFQGISCWYNNLDVVPFLEAVEKMSRFWQERKIDMFKDGISLPGLTLKYLFSFLDKQTYFSLFDRTNSDLYHLIKDNNTGGPSIIFHRYHEAEKTRIRETERGQAVKLCQKIAGYDANALYLWAVMQNMPTGSYTRRLAENEFKPKGSIKMAIEWLEWVAHKERIHIRHQLNNVEKRVGDRKLPVDGFNPETQTVYQFHGCYWHGHDCALIRGK